jgi:hypothetical protein
MKEPNSPTAYLPALAEKHVDRIVTLDHVDIGLREL